MVCIYRGLPWWLSGKESTCPCRRCRFDPWVKKILWRRKWQPTPGFLPGTSRGQRSLVGNRNHKRVRHDLATKQQQCYILLYITLFSCFYDKYFPVIISQKNTLIFNCDFGP